MRFALPSATGKHCFGIVMFSLAAFFFILFVTYAGWDVGDAKSGDVVRPMSSFSSFERACFEVSRAMTAPMRWFRIGDSTTAAIAELSVLSLGWGFVGYTPLVRLVRTVRKRTQKLPL